MASSSFNLKITLSITVLLILFFAVSPANGECDQSKYGEGCRDRAKALKFKIIAIGCILITSMIGVCLPLFSRFLPALQPDRDLFVVVKAFASGVILATGYMHVLPDSFDDLRSECLPKDPWHKFPFTTFIAMVAAIFTLMVDSFSISFFRKKLSNTDVEDSDFNGNNQVKELEQFGHGHGHGHFNSKDGQQLLRYRVVAQVLEAGIVVHSVVIGLSMGASDNPCTIRPLIAALCFHQLFEGMGLGGSILQAEYGLRMKTIMVFFFSTTTPFGIVLGIGLSKVYSDTSPSSLIVEGILNAVSAGLLNYMALVDLLAAEFMGPKLQGNLKLQSLSYIAVLLGAGGMALMAKWA
ncbi:hypothetical protein L6164_026972 [Bauhinia variegata]|uniref:Uncharacterized protein n=1 Tax=Bauhinia variegata TaxID=167791 RepID=A0ACB9LTA5_BAUVA|nr:hypothetical protein L6164_026972 [Bauhinia variegata]